MKSLEFAFEIHWPLVIQYDLFLGMPAAKFSEDKPLDFGETAIKKLDQVIGKPV